MGTSKVLPLLDSTQLLHFTAFSHCNALHGIEMHNTALYSKIFNKLLYKYTLSTLPGLLYLCSKTWQFTALHHIAQHFTALCSLILYCLALCCKALHGTTLQCNELHGLRNSCNGQQWPTVPIICNEGDVAKRFPLITSNVARFIPAYSFGWTSKPFWYLKHIPFFFRNQISTQNATQSRLSNGRILQTRINATPQPTGRSL